MKYILMFVLCILTTFASADKVRLNLAAVVETICLDGYLFAVASGTQGLHVVQVFKPGDGFGNPATPVECK
jgi:hypothetical protein